MPQDEEVLEARIDENVVSARDESEGDDEDTALTPRTSNAEVDDINESTDLKVTGLRAPSAKVSPSSAQSTPAKSKNTYNAERSDDGAIGRPFLTSSGSSPWLSSQTVRNKPSTNVAPTRNPTTFGSAQHRNGGTAVASTTEKITPSQMPKRGLVQRFVSEKNVRTGAGTATTKVPLHPAPALRLPTQV